MKKFKEIFKPWTIYNNQPFLIRVQKVLANFLDIYHLHLNESIVTNYLALAVGLIAGFGSVGFRLLINLFKNDWFPAIRIWISSVSAMPFDYTIIIIPVIGGAIIAPIIYYLAREAKGHGVPEVIEAVALRGGRFRLRIVWVKALVSAICIGSGGSVGREGPIVQIGSAMGSTFSNAFHMSTERRRWLVACGAAGGIAATFNAPIAGVLFAMEVILRQATLKTVTSIVLASVAASVVGHYFFGDVPAFIVPEYTLVNWRELFFYTIMGILGAFVSLLYTNSIYFFEDIFDRIKIHELAKPALGGLFLGLVLFFLPQVQGVGYETIELCLQNRIGFQILIALVFAKILATSLSLGSGGSGGVFAPSLFIGAMFGGAFGYAIPFFYDGAIAEPGAYALVGMGTVFAGSARAPLTAIIILFELTGEYNIILPLMISVVVAGIVANHFQQDSIYTLKLTRRGTQLFAGHDLGILSSLLAKDVMIKDIETFKKDLTIAEFKEAFMDMNHHAFPVMDGDKLYGVFTYNDYCRRKDMPDETKISEICSRRLVTVTEDDDLKQVLSKFMPRDVRMIMVVDSNDPFKLRGILTRTNIFDAYRIALKKRNVSGETLIDVDPH
ncbi:chloride channel protein [bacterium]|nr:chloride channel protein [bacterium]